MHGLKRVSKRLFELPLLCVVAGDDYDADWDERSRFPRGKLKASLGESGTIVTDLRRIVATVGIEIGAFCSSRARSSSYRAAEHVSLGALCASACKCECAAARA